MTTTAAQALTSTWTQVSTGSEGVAIQLLPNAAPAYVYVGATAPEAGTVVGFYLSSSPGGEASFVAKGLSGTDNVYVRAVGVSNVIVIKS